MTDNSLKALTLVFKEVGPVGFILILGAGIFIIYGTEAQKQEFIDTYILLKRVSENPAPFTMVVIALVFFIFMLWVYYHQRFKYLKEEIKRIGAEKSKLQSELLDKQLRSSDKPDHQ
ncbi:MAG: hypothetical protein JNK77_01060 [Saprospiraceae bacterium]|nr:hypothetical protein [Saprospiraceae bacterium]